MSFQRYVSDELTHFVGRKFHAAIKEDGEREETLYELLIQILKEGTLLAIGDWLGDPAKRPEGAKWVSWDPNAKLGEMFTPTVVCFCDIPVEDIGIHMSKYSEFGIGFSRQFLLQRGANPVLYLAADAVLDDDGGTTGELFEVEIRRTVKFIQSVMFAEQHGRDDVPADVVREATLLNMFLMPRLFPLIKPFRGDLSDEDPENFYMEREWRLHGDLDFGLGDVRRLYLPERFAKRLRTDLPDYYGQVTFSG